MRLRILFVPAILAVSLACSGHKTPEQVGEADGVPVYKMGIERLPDLNIPRSGHVLAYVDGELTAIGGHTTGFVPTLTAEFFRDGAWQKVETVYPHDHGAGVRLSSGEMVVAGGCIDPFGVGGSLGVELYDPAAHSFSPLPILDRKRTMAGGAQLSDGNLVFSGNWYDGDAVTLYSLESGGVTVKETMLGRARPYICCSGPDNVLIFSSRGSLGEELDPGRVDRLRGEPLDVPLLREWCPFDTEIVGWRERLFIGDEVLGGYAWLIPAFRREDGQAGIIRLTGERFSLLDTELPVPMISLEGEKISWSHLHVDRETENAYLYGMSAPGKKAYVCQIGYGAALRGGKAPVVLFFADLGYDGGRPELDTILMPGGRIAVAGGILDDHYHPLSAAFILHTEGLPGQGGFPWWLVAGALLTGVAVLVFLRRRGPDPEARPDNPVRGDGEQLFKDMMTRIRAMMEEKELFRNPDLKAEDLAAELGTNTAYVRGCISGFYDGSFTDFVNEYRIRYVQRLLREDPGAKVTLLAEEAGFSSTATFYRHFAAVTGLSPFAWLKKEREGTKEFF